MPSIPYALAYIRYLETFGIHQTSVGWGLYKTFIIFPYKSKICTLTSCTWSIINKSRLCSVTGECHVKVFWIQEFFISQKPGFERLGSAFGGCKPLL